MKPTEISELQRLFMERGSVVEAEGNRPLIIRDEKDVWMVRDGHADVFAVALHGGEVVRQRQFLFAVQPGQLLFGYYAGDGGERDGDVSADVDSGSAGILIAGLTGTRLLRMDRADFMQAVAGSTVMREAAAMSIDAWVHAWSTVLAVSEPLEQVIDLKLDQAAQGLSDYNRYIADCLRQRYQFQERFEQERLKLKTEQDQVVMERAIRRLASVTGSSDARAAVAVDSQSGDELHAAARCVGEALGLEVKSAAARQMQQSRDPVSEIAKVSGFRSRQVMLKDDWWKRDNGPLLAFIEEGGKPVALIPQGPSRYCLINPADGSETVVTEQLAGTLETVAHMFYRSLPAYALSIWDILKFGNHRTIRRDFARVMLLAAAGGLLGMFVPVANGILFDAIIPSAQQGPLLQMGVILLSVTVATALFELTRSIAMLRIEGEMDGSVQAAVWDRLLSLPVSFFRNYSAGDLASRANSINAIRQMLSGIAINAVFSGVFSCFNFFLLFHYDVKLAIAAAVLVFIPMLVTIAVGFVQVRKQRELLRLQGKLMGTVLQMINGISKFRMAAAEKRAFFLWAKLFGEMKEVSFQSRTTNNIHEVFNSFFPIVSSIVLFYLVASNPNSLSAGQFIAFFSAFTAFLGAMLAMSSAAVSIMNIVPQYERAKPILQSVPEVHEAMEDPGELAGAIEVHHVSFRYAADQPLVLNDLSLNIRPGEFVALVGASGCGKSTLLRMLLGFEKAESGSIYFDGQDLKSLDIRSVRNQFGVVLQHGKVMAGDIYTNIVGSSNLTHQEAWEAARMVGFDQDIQQMPMGMHTVISEGGGTLSGGQRQRMLIARALARRPKILFFDEATSALDNRTQAIVSESLEKLRATRVVIAHRLSTIMNADRIFVLDKGRLVQAGTYADLMEQDGLFVELAKRQLA